MTEQKEDNTVVKIVIGITLGFFALSLVNNSESNSSFNWSDDDVSTIISQTNEAFDLAEEKILEVKPNPDDTPNGPDPDVEKCICGGTGVIIQGDGHKTDCPYHPKKN
tara:strand:+ start:23 stop:346 length:324 start_codon:yes stop_codon:yes gene_type:complete